MQSKRLRSFVAAVVGTTAFIVLLGKLAYASSAAGLIFLLQPYPDPTGIVQTVASTTNLDITGPFFQSLGTNGRNCSTCHLPSDGWTITPPHIQQRFTTTQGLDPLFRTVDGSNSPTADVSTLAARQSAYSMLLTKGLIRIGLPIPPGAQFTLEAVDDPYGYASATELSLFRRPLPATNLRYLSTVMWDGRESAAGLTLAQELANQSNDATTGHAQGAPISLATQQQIVAFESAFTTAQSVDFVSGRPNALGATGGPDTLANQPFFLGINDPLGHNPTGAPFNPVVFSMFNSWGSLVPDGTEVTAGRLSVARGEALFNTHTFTATGVAGLNDTLNQPAVQVTCTTCHSTPGVGDHSVGLPLNIGLTDLSQRTPDLPLYTLKNNNTGATVQTTDPGRALITGQWADVGKFKGAILRGLASRAPYFHNGSAATLEDAVNFYNTRFNIGFTAQQETDIANFLRTL